MRRPRSLYRRQAIYYWRRVIPARFVRGGRPTEIRLSLSTSVYSLAVFRAHRLSAELDRHLQVEMKAELLSPQQWRDLLRKFLADELEEMEAQRAFEGELTPEAAADLSRIEKQFAEGWRKQLTRNNAGAIDWAHGSFHDKYDVELDPASPRYERLARDIMRALIQAHEINAERYLGHYREDQAAPFVPPSPLSGSAHDALATPPIAPSADPLLPPDPAAGQVARDESTSEAHEAAFTQRFGEVVDFSKVESSGPPLAADSLLSEAFNALRLAKKTDEKWQDETERKLADSANLIIEILGDRPLNSYTQAQAKKARAVIRRIPYIRGRSPKERPSIEALIQAADKQEQANLAAVERKIENRTLDPDNAEIERLNARVKRLTLRTVSNHMRNASQLFKFAREEKKLAIENPFFKLGYGKKAVAQSPDRKVRVLDDDDFETLFRSPLYTGCKSIKRRWQPGTQIERDALYWIPLLEAFAGLRLEEACQLGTGDIRIFFGVPWMVIEGTKTKRTKSAASNRCVPIHPFLIALGFMSYIGDMKKRGKHRLFPGLKRDTRGKLGGYLSKQYTSYRRRIGLDAPGKDGHALRHAFDTWLHNEEVPTVRIAELMGHERDGMTDGTYFHGSTPERLWLAIKKLTYGFKVAIVNGEPQLVRDDRERWAIDRKFSAIDPLQLEPPATIIDVTPAPEGGKHDDEAA